MDLKLRGGVRGFYRKTSNVHFTHVAKMCDYNSFRDQADLKKLYIISIANNEANMYTVNCQNVDAANR